MASTASVSEQRVLEEFLQLVQIDSVTYEEGEIAGVLEARLRDLGFSVANDGTGPSTGNLIARLPGTVEGAATIAFDAHMDTVQPGRGVRPVVRDGVVWSSGDTILGADCKASIAATLEGVRAVLEAGIPRPEVEVLLTWSEERGHAGAKALDLSRLRAGVCFVLDASQPIGTIITAAPAYRSLRVSFRGRESHSGSVPEKGINALVAAARAIARMPLGRIDHETTANIGLIKGGTARNTVPALVEMEGEARSRDNAKLAAQVEAMVAAMREEAEGIGATVEIESKREYDAFNVAPDAPVVLAARRALERLGIPVRLAPTGGGSDANDLNVMGLPSVVLATGMSGVHTLQEHIAVADLVNLSRLVAELTADAGRQTSPPGPLPVSGRGPGG